MRNVMTINLSGSPGPDTGGLTQMGGAAPAPVAPAKPRAARATATSRHPAARPSVPIKTPAHAPKPPPSRKAPATPEPSAG